MTSDDFLAENVERGLTRSGTIGRHLIRLVREMMAVMVATVFGDESAPASIADASVLISTES
ncbi:hypothetical protein [Rhizobium sp. Leaf383]|uniref:hypothetical protein n=1 Tax=Rhizobium sp. Leaf383 TaxID=1736357 RepID=UPI0007123904|nr:hypothetical protein [Rhizobium sp. Leaf383]KQS81662.1 hypothetical protein ASG58_22590 [Rhizobium sp. Leaf383]